MANLKFLFWNIDKRDVTQRLVRLASSQGFDVLMLAESNLDPIALTTALNAASGAGYAFQPSDRNKIQVYSTSKAGAVVEQFVDGPGSITIRQFELPEAPAVLVAVLHLPSKLNWSPATQAMHSVTVARDIRLVEDDVGHDRTIVVGDLNMNPFDPGVVGAEGFNAVLSRREARLRARTVQGRGFRYFFNPMWAFLKDQSGKASGTFYHRAPPPDGQAWNVYDQILVRPSLISCLEFVDIIESDGVSKLSNANGIPIRHTGSDHLPLAFTLNV